MDWSIFGDFDHITFPPNTNVVIPKMNTCHGDYETCDTSHCQMEDKARSQQQVEMEDTEEEEGVQGEADDEFQTEFCEEGDHDIHDNSIGSHVSLLIDWQKVTGLIGVSKRADELKRDDILGREWPSMEAAETFFKVYAKMMGFGVRKGRVKKRQNAEIRVREWLCSREGERDEKYLNMTNRKREARALTRFGCKVMLRVSHRSETNLWVATEFRTTHSHRLADPSHVVFLRSNRSIEPGSLEMAKSLRSAGMRTCHIMAFMAQQAGGYQNMTHTIKDLYNRIGQNEAIDLSDPDAAKTIGYLEHKCAHDVSFYGKYSYDAHFRLENLVWADGRCQSDYAKFGHAIAFDTTYKTNAYGKPLLVWVGINRHFRTMVLGFGLMKDETINTYTWVTEAFLECMKGMKPMTVVTDGNHAIKATIDALMPETKHRLCACHIHKNAVDNVKKKGFHAKLKKLIYWYYKEETFAQEWEKLMTDFKLHDNPWVQDLYARRTSWSDSFNRGHFFAWMSTTQRNEGINSALKKKLRKSVKLYDLVQRLDMALSAFRFQEAQDNFETLNSFPLIGQTNMCKVEEQAARVYTRAMFYRVREQILKEGKYRVILSTQSNQLQLFELKKYNDESIKRHVLYDADEESYTCECQYYPSKGIPCRHIFACMKATCITEIPKSLIWKHWTMDSWTYFDENKSFNEHCKNTCSEVSTRFAHIHNRATNFAYYASKSHSLFRKAEEIIESGCMELRNAWEQDGGGDEEHGENFVNERCFLRNPRMTRTKGTYSINKGRHRSQKRCSNCKKTGHNRTTCNRQSTNRNNVEALPESDSDYENADMNLWYEEETHKGNEGNMSMEEEEEGDNSSEDCEPF